MPEQACPSKITTVLLDRDGTVIIDKNYLSDPAGVELLPGAAEGLHQFSHAGMRLFIVTNQSGIGRGYFTEADYHSCHDALVRLLSSHGATLAGSAFCPHAPEEACNCRKPSLGMWQALASQYDLAPARTVMIGDKAEDIAFGRTAGVAAAILVLTGKGAETATRLRLPLPELGAGFCPVVDAIHGATLPHAVAKDLAGAAAYILGLEAP